MTTLLDPTKMQDPEMLEAYRQAVETVNRGYKTAEEQNRPHSKKSLSAQWKHAKLQADGRAQFCSRIP